MRPAFFMPFSSSNRRGRRKSGSRRFTESRFSFPRRAWRDSWQVFFLSRFYTFYCPSPFLCFVMKLCADHVTPFLSTSPSKGSSVRALFRTKTHASFPPRFFFPSTGRAPIRISSKAYLTLPSKLIRARRYCAGLHYDVFASEVFFLYTLHRGICLRDTFVPFSEC